MLFFVGLSTQKAAPRPLARYRKDQTALLGAFRVAVCIEALFKREAGNLALPLLLFQQGS